MVELNPDELVIDHFKLLKDKRAIDDAIRRNTTETAQVLAKAGHFDALAVNWTHAKRIFHRLS